MDRDRSVQENLGLVHACAKRFKGRGIEYDDLYQAGCLGLVKAVDHFDESRGLRFSTYAVPVILGEMRRLFRDGGAVKVGRSLKELSVRASRKAAEFAEKEGRSPTVGELAELLGVEPSEAAQALGAAQMPLSLTASEEEGGGQIDVSVEGEDEKIAEILSLKQVVKELPPKDQNIIYFRYFKRRTQTETAQALGMTQVQVSRREKVILQELRRKLV
ncbi:MULTISPECIES: sigma-70 family RNA polymerase sigma factor [Eubacteriales]|uniref:sigma-70 family RNA polymerase sigma factor n=1 Tax=Eubacteriales TaxID=186802 RepID=UPI000681AAE5|nr:MULTISPECIES: sigma-70 family RNA polymerase sigma factor [Eubacteriales]